LILGCDAAPPTRGGVSPQIAFLHNNQYKNVKTLAATLMKDITINASTLCLFFLLYSNVRSVGGPPESVWLFDTSYVTVASINLKYSFDQCVRIP